MPHPYTSVHRHEMLSAFARRHGTWRTAIVASLTLAVCAACSSSGSGSNSGNASQSEGASAASTKQVTIKYDQANQSAGEFPIYVGMHEGFFKQEGINLDLITSNSSSVGAIQGVLGGSADIAGETGWASAVTAVTGGSSLTLVAGMENSLPYTINGPKGATSLSQLVGKKIGVASATDQSMLAWQLAAKAEGLKPSQFTYVYTPGSSPRLAAMLSGRLDATILTPPSSFEVEAQGYSSLGHPGQLTLPFSVLAVTSSWAKSHKADLVAFMKAYLKSIAWAYDPANEAAAKQIFESGAGTKSDVVDETYDFFCKQLKPWPTNGKVPTGVKATTLLNGMVEMGAVKTAPAVSSFVDNSYVDAAAAALGIKS